MKVEIKEFLFYQLLYMFYIPSYLQLRESNQIKGPKIFPLAINIQAVLVTSRTYWPIPDCFQISSQSYRLKQNLRH